MVLLLLLGAHWCNDEGRRASAASPDPPSQVNQLQLPLGPCHPAVEAQAAHYCLVSGLQEMVGRLHRQGQL
jgi:hypothetical protein